MTDNHGAINVIAACGIDPAINRSEMTVGVGKTIAEIVNIALPGLTAHDRLYVRVMLVDDRGSMLVGEEWWHAVRPKDGVRVIIRLLPGKNALRGILQIVVSIAAIALGQFWAAGLGFTAGTLGFNVASGLIGLGVPVIGALKIDALVCKNREIDEW